MSKGFNIYLQISRKGKQLLLPCTCTLTHTDLNSWGSILVEQALNTSGGRLNLGPRKHHEDQKELWSWKMSLCSWRNDRGRILKETDKDQETERHKETRKGLLRLIHILDTKQGHALHIVRQGNIFLLHVSFKVSLVSLKAIPIGPEQTKEMCH